MELLSVMVQYLRRNYRYAIISISPSAIIVYGQQPVRSWSAIEIGCHCSPLSLSTAAIRIHHQLPPRPWSTTIIRCQHDKGSGIILTISRHDTESAILDPLERDDLWYAIQVLIHDVATAAALDLRTIRQKDSGEEVKSVCPNLDKSVS